MDIGKRITELREMRGLTVNKLANLSGVSQSHLRDIELSKKSPTVETLSYICYALKVSLPDFFAYEHTDISPFLMSAVKCLNKHQQEKLADFIDTI